jgi:glycine dehydrogenase subunit 1
MPSAHPYIPNSAPSTKSDMLSAIGVDDIGGLYASIPDSLRLEGELNLPPAFRSEFELKRHIDGILARNVTTTEVLSFLGAGCYPHYVPAVCSEVNSRAEFLTAYAGEPYEDHGKWQAIFEYTSLMAELLEMDVVNVPNYDGHQAAATALRMAVRVTARRRVIVSAAVPAAKRAKIDTYLDGAAEVLTVPIDPATGRIDRAALEGLLDDTIAAVFIESPNVFGVVESDAEALATMVHAYGGLVVCSTDPIALGFLPAPASWGADIVCGDIQSLGLGMHFGGANGGFIASHDEERIVFEYPSRLFGLAPTAVDGEIGFCDVAYERTSLAMREEGVEWVGTAAALWGITAGVYLSLVGPRGLSEIGDTIAAYTRYAIEELSRVPGVDLPFRESAHWRELVVRYRDTTVAEVNEKLRECGILGGADISDKFPGLGQLSVFCLTELHEQADVDRLVRELRKVLA